MSPKEKANQLVNTYYNSIMSFLTNNMKLENAKKCALIAVDEIIDAVDWHEFEVPNDVLHYYFEVKQEIQKI
jgi:hypothetical protein